MRYKRLLSNQKRSFSSPGNNIEISSSVKLDVKSEKDFASSICASRCAALPSFEIETTLERLSVSWGIISTNPLTKII